MVMSDRSVVGAMRLKRSRPLLRASGFTLLLGLFLCLVHTPSGCGLDGSMLLGVLLLAASIVLLGVSLLVAVWRRVAARARER
jgi:hypothetical protein